MHAETKVHARSVFEAMRDDHLSLERRLKELLERAHEDDREELRTAFRALETELRSHLEAEERDLLPRFDLLAPAEAQRIRADHALIRSGLDALALEVDLRSVRAHTIADYASLLRQHAEREDRTLYKWADSGLSEREKWPLLKWLGARVEERALDRRERAAK